jgi:geranylgeranyl diphosphate synthase type II
LDAIAKGAFEMVMGQSLDVNSGGDESLLRKLQDFKTGALFRAAVSSGAACAGATAQQRESLVRFADAYGLLFQITDDILDVAGDASVLGKTVGKDAEEGKTTFVTVYGLDAAKEFAKNYATEAREAVLEINPAASFFTELIDYTLKRKS